MSTVVLLTFACCATVHLVVTCVMGLYSRHRVEYLSLAWIMGIFTCVLLVVTPFSHSVATGQPGILHPYMLLTLVCGIYLQSIYTFGFSMPGFLQWERMWKYASPILILAAVYILAMYPVGKLTKVYSADELFQNIYNIDLFLRVVALGMGIYYIINILYLPHRFANLDNVPTFVKGYGTMLTLSCIFYVYVAINYTPLLLCVFLILFTCLNLYMVLRTLETTASHLAHPVINLEENSEEFAVEPQKKEEVPEEEITEEDKRQEAEKQEVRQHNFNQLNRERYQRVEKWMHTHHLEWTDHTFNRERLCEATGINRQLLLQCLRSQGHNNIHDYLMLYRVEELKRLIKRGEVTAVSESFNAGFGAPKTARMAFEKIEGVSLDSYIDGHRRAQ